MIKLDKVSKYYYSNGMVSSGISKVSLEFNMGEFIAITGASGSGKSTLLNVISGLDTYEDGEMYINGKETSHYTEREYEDYRRNYIGNIFQNFNFIFFFTNQSQAYKFIFAIYLKNFFIFYGKTHKNPFNR